VRVEAVNSVRGIVSGDQLGIRQSEGDVNNEKAQGAAAQRSEDVLSRDEESTAPDYTRRSLADLLQESECSINFQLSFTFHKETEQLVVKVIDPNSNRVIREIPPEELLDLAVRLQEMLGLLFDKRV